LGIEFTFQIPGTPIELSLGLGFPPKEEPTPTPTPTPTPSPSPSPSPSPLPNRPLPPVIENTYVPPGDPSLCSNCWKYKSATSYYNGVAWECGGQWMSDHLGYNREGTATISGDVLDEDDKNSNFSGNPFPLRYRLTAQTNKAQKERNVQD
jgi:hypothetical protein